MCSNAGLRFTGQLIGELLFADGAALVCLWKEDLKNASAVLHMLESVCDLSFTGFNKLVENSELWCKA